MSSLNLTTKNYERETGRKPTGSRFWVINRTRTEEALERDLIGGLRGFRGTIDEVKTQAEQAGLTGTWAVLP